MKAIYPAILLYFFLLSVHAEEVAQVPANTAIEKLFSTHNKIECTGLLGGVDKPGIKAILTMKVDDSKLIEGNVYEVENELHTNNFWDCNFAGANVLSCLLDAGRVTVSTTLKFGDNTKNVEVYFDRNESTGIVPSKLFSGDCTVSDELESEKQPKDESFGISETHINLSKGAIGVDTCWEGGYCAQGVVKHEAKERNRFHKLTRWGPRPERFPYKNGRYDPIAITYDGKPVILNDSIKYQDVAIQAYKKLTTNQQVAVGDITYSPEVDYLYYHYSDRVEVVPALSMSGSAEYELKNKINPFVHVTLFNLGKQSIARLEINGIAVNIGSDAKPSDMDAQTCFRPSSHGGQLMTPLDQAWTVRWQYLSADPAWHQAIVPIHFVKTSDIKNGQFGEAKVFLYFMPDDKVGAERLQGIWNGDKYKVRLSGLPKGMSFKPPCGTGKDFFIDDMIDNAWKQEVRP
jgi:hypothetical protein